MLSGLSRFQIFAIVFTSVLSFSALYATQPIQPVFMTYFGVDKSTSALVTTVTMLPLAIAPIIYGYILESFSSKTLLRFSVFILAVLQLGIYFVSSFKVLLIIRFFVGAVLPAILTSLMTYISNASVKENVQKYMAIYISSTIVGGFAGRFFSGLIASLFSWRISFLILSISLAAAFFVVGHLREEKLSLSKFRLDAVIEVLRIKRFFGVYLMVFSMFFMFAAVLNFIPYRIQELDSSSSVFRIGMMYTGYIMGLAVSLNSMKFIKFFGSELKTIIFGLSSFGLFLFIFQYKSLLVLFIGMFLFCGAMFLSHSVASGYLNKLAYNRKGITNGLYVAFYYSGGTLGSVIPGYIYANAGWNYFLIFLAAVMFSTIFASIIIIKTER